MPGPFLDCTSMASMPAHDLMMDDEDDEQEDSQEGEEQDDGKEEEYDRRMFGISQALPVPEGPLPELGDDGLPETAEEYLQWVRYEASRCPRVVRAEVRSDNLASTASASSSYLANMERSQAMPDGPTWAQPTNSWARQLLGSFRTLRQQLVDLAAEHEDELHHVRLPNAHDLKAWDWLCFGPGGDSGEVQPPPAPPQHPAQAVPPPPSPAMQLQQGHSTGCGTSQHEGQWLGQGAGGSTEGHSGHQEGQRGKQGVQGVQGPHGAEQAGLGAGASAKGAPMMDQLPGPMLRTVLAMDQVRVVALTTWLVEGLDSQPCLSYSRSQWLFALAACLEKPIHGGTGAAFRSLMRRCCVLRSELQDPHDPQLPLLNTLIVVAGGYFGQEERLAKLVADQELP